MTDPEEGRFGLRESTIAKINEVFASHPNVKQAILYGSRAKGTAREGSDIDLVLSGEHLSLGELMKISAEIDDLLLPYKVDLSVLGQIENRELLAHIERVGKIFYDACGTNGGKGSCCSCRRR